MSGLAMFASPRSLAWTVVSIGASIAARKVAGGLLTSAWKAMLGDDPPSSGGESGEGWVRPLVWTAGSAALIAAAELGARRGTAIVWTRVTGDPPPGA